MSETVSLEPTQLYITEMLRWGETETHHYIVGVYSTFKQAELAGEAEKTWRGGKYEYKISPLNLDEGIPEDVLEHHLACMPAKENLNDT